MFQFAVVDDEKEFILHFIKIICDYIENEKHNLCRMTACCSGNEILSLVENKKLDCIFLDIEMSNENGIEIGEKIKNKYPQINVVFVTNNAELVYDSLKIKPDGFIRKSHLETELHNWLDHYINEYEILKESFTIKEKNKYINLQISEVLYFESSGNYLFICLKNNKYKIKSTLSMWEDRLKNKNFVRVHSGYIVNVDKIFDITDYTITLDNGEKIPISRKRKKSVISIFYKGL